MGGRHPVSTTGEGLWVVVPVRSLSEGKTRLAGDLTPDERRQLTIRMLRHVITAIAGSGVAKRIVVVSGDPNALAVAVKASEQVMPVAQPDHRPGLNNALDVARDVAVQHGAEQVMVLFADLPLLTPDDLGVMADALEPGAMVIAADRHGQGTNGLLLPLDAAGRAFSFQFGTVSAGKHRAEASGRGLRAVDVRTVGLGFDLDTGSDLAHYAREDMAESWGRGR